MSNQKYHPRAGQDNREHLHRHIVCALEDFEGLEKDLLSYPGISVETKMTLHAISHHLRHAKYRSGKEVK